MGIKWVETGFLRPSTGDRYNNPVGFFNKSDGNNSDRYGNVVGWGDFLFALLRPIK